MHQILIHTASKLKHRYGPSNTTETIDSGNQCAMGDNTESIMVYSSYILIKQVSYTTAIGAKSTAMGLETT